MDNNNLNPQTPPLNTPPQPVQQPVPQPTFSNPTNESNRMVLWLVIGLVIIIVVIGGIYIFLSKQQTAAPKEQTITSQTPAPQENLESDLNSIDVGNATDESDLAPIDQDIQQL